MTCPFVNFHVGKTVRSNEKLSYEIYELEADIIRKRNQLGVLREKRIRLDEEEKKRKMGTVTNIEQELKKIKRGYNFRKRGNIRKFDNLFTSILYTLKDMNTRLTALENIKTVLPAELDEVPLNADATDASTDASTDADVDEELPTEVVEARGQNLFGGDCYSRGVEGAVVDASERPERPETPKTPETSDNDNKETFDWGDNEDWGEPDKQEIEQMATVKLVDFKPNSCKVAFDDKCRFDCTS